MPCIEPHDVGKDIGFHQNAFSARDAFVIDNSHLTSTEQFDLALGHVVKVIGVVAEA